MAVVRRAAADTPPRRGRPRNRRPAIYRGYETLEVVGESFCQDALWALVGMTRGSRVREQIVAVLEPEPTNPWDCNAIQVLIDDVPVGHLSREDARAYLPGLLRLIESCETRCVGLEGVITGGGTRSDGPGFLGVFLDHDPTHFGVRRHFVSLTTPTICRGLTHSQRTTGRLRARSSSYSSTSKTRSTATSCSLS
jgi:hypothetical protein